ncbi:hypothetical protein ARMSODRAFT_449793 [Armillaria solidipes]|uniref:Uncharacterized protein n=1 Tax=Armillaria solidipes TaxID=1076256 RepID=A0A2H3BMB1_9AGAR|nr:hypothetical protein ARMSODRAFT_449793 [Armillaria solidipes]
MAEKDHSLADHLSSGRPTNILRPPTYPCTVVNRRTSRKVKIQPLIGSADDGVYLNPPDIQKLGLNDTGHTIATHQGPSRVYSGVSFSFKNQDGDGVVRYDVPYVLALVVDAVHSDTTFNTKRDGIVGIPHIDKHLVSIHCSDVYLVNLSVLPSLAQYFTKMVPLCDARFDRNLRPRITPPWTYITDFSTIYSAALTYRAPLYNVLLQHMAPCFATPRRAGHVRSGRGSIYVSVPSVRRRAERRGPCTVEQRARGRIGRDTRRSIQGRSLGTSRINVHAWSLFSRRGRAG